MLNFEEWNKTHFVYIDKDNTRGELKIAKKVVIARLPTRNIPDSTIYKHEIKKGTVISFEEAFKLAKEENKVFDPHDMLSCYRIYFTLQEELGRNLWGFTHIYFKNFGSKKRLICPDESDERLAHQYHIANALLGFQEDYDSLNDEAKGRIPSHKRTIEALLENND